MKLHLGYLANRGGQVGSYACFCIASPTNCDLELRCILGTLLVCNDTAVLSFFLSAVYNFGDSGYICFIRHANVLMGKVVVASQKSDLIEQCY